MPNMNVYELHCFSIKMVHQVIRRLLDRIAQGPESPLADVDAYKGFLQSCVLFIHHHHKNEDDIMFPCLKSKNLDLLALDQMSMTHSKLNALLDELTNLASADHLDLNALRKAGSDLSTMMVEHMDQEEALCTPQNYECAGVSFQDVQDMDDRIAQETQKEDAAIFLPIIYYNLTHEERTQWWNQVLPWHLRWIIFPWILAPKYAGYWRFCLNGPTHG